MSEITATAQPTVDLFRIDSAVASDVATSAPITSDVVKRAAERGEALYDNGMFCCETVLTVANEAAGNRLPAEVMSLGSGFWGGMAGDGSTCGALVGAVMACGLLAGRTHTAGAWEPSTDAAEEIRRAFRTEHGSVSCNCLIRPFGGMDGEGRHAHCARLTGATSAMVVRIAEERGWL